MMLTVAPELSKRLLAVPGHAYNLFAWGFFNRRSGEFSIGENWGIFDRR
jgi:hypothetical protein